MVGALDDEVDEHAEGDRATPGLDLLLWLLHEVGWEENTITISLLYLIGRLTF